MEEMPLPRLQPAHLDDHDRVLGNPLLFARRPPPLGGFSRLGQRHWRIDHAARNAGEQIRQPRLREAAVYDREVWPDPARRTLQPIAALVKSMGPEAQSFPGGAHRLAEDHERPRHVADDEIKALPSEELPHAAARTPACP